MSNLNENLDKAKSFVEDTAKKAKESEAYNKFKDTANEVTQKIKDNETVAGAIDKINQNEYVKKVNKSKYSKLIKIGAVAIALVVIYNVFFFLFADKKAQKAQEYMTSEIVAILKDGGATNESVKAKAIGKNEDADMYAFDTTIKYKANGKDYETTSYFLVYSGDEGSYLVNRYDYEDENKQDMKDIVLAKLARG